MVKLEKYTGAKVYMFPSGGIGNQEAVLQDFPGALQFTHVVHTDDAGEVMFGLYNLSAMCAQKGVDLSLGEAAKIAALEAVMNTPEPAPQPSAEERIAAAMEFQNVMSL